MDKRVNVDFLYLTCSSKVRINSVILSHESDAFLVVFNLENRIGISTLDFSIGSEAIYKSL